MAEIARKPRLQAQLKEPENVKEPLFEGKDIGNGIEIQKLEAIGGFAFTYFALKKQADEFEEVAVKVFKQQVNYDSVMEEREFLKYLKHPRVPRFVDSGEATADNGTKRYWIAMEWISGRSLGEYAGSIAGKGKPKEWLELLEPIFEALELAHNGKLAVKFAHCDISPRNILIEGKNGQSKAWLVDFGIAKRLENEKDRGQTRSVNSTVASPDFLHPEYFTKGRRSAATDVHALGLILTWLLTNEMPYCATSEDPLKQEVMSKLRPTPRNKGFDVGNYWEGVIAKALALDPDDRYETAGKFLEALQKNVPDKIKPIEKRDASIKQKEKIDLILRSVALHVGILSVGWAALNYTGPRTERPNGEPPFVSAPPPPSVFATETPYPPVVLMSIREDAPPNFPGRAVQSLNLGIMPAPPGVPEPVVPNLQVTPPAEREPTPPITHAVPVPPEDEDSALAQSLPSLLVPAPSDTHEAHAPAMTISSLSASISRPLANEVAKLPQASPSATKTLALNVSNLSPVSMQIASTTQISKLHSEQEGKKKNPHNGKAPYDPICP